MFFRLFATISVIAGFEHARADELDDAIRRAGSKSGQVKALTESEKRARAEARKRIAERNNSVGSEDFTQPVARPRDRQEALTRIKGYPGRTKMVDKDGDDSREALNTKGDEKDRSRYRRCLESGRSARDCKVLIPPSSKSPPPGATAKKLSPSVRAAIGPTDANYIFKTSDSGVLTENACVFDSQAYGEEDCDDDGPASSRLIRKLPPGAFLRKHFGDRAYENRALDTGMPADFAYFNSENAYCENLGIEKKATVQGCINMVFLRKGQPAIKIDEIIDRTERGTLWNSEVKGKMSQCLTDNRLSDEEAKCVVVGTGYVPKTQLFGKAYVPPKAEATVADRVCRDCKQNAAAALPDSNEVVGKNLISQTYIGECPGGGSKFKQEEDFFVKRESVTVGDAPACKITIGNSCSDKVPVYYRNDMIIEATYGVSGKMCRPTLDMFYENCTEWPKNYVSRYKKLSDTVGSVLRKLRSERKISTPVNESLLKCILGIESGHNKPPFEPMRINTDRCKTDSRNVSSASGVGQMTRGTLKGNWRYHKFLNQFKGANCPRQPYCFADSPAGAEELFDAMTENPEIQIETTALLLNHEIVERGRTTDAGVGVYYMGEGEGTPERRRIRDRYVAGALACRQKCFGSGDPGSGDELEYKCVKDYTTTSAY